MTTASRRLSRSRGGTRRRRARRPSEPVDLHEAPPPPIALDEPVSAPEAAPPAPTDGGPPPQTELATPEPALADRMPPPEPERPLPASRRVILFDVENASRAEHIGRVIDHLAIDRMGKRTDFIAVGNWRVIGHDTARLLARHGAQLVHSAPSVGVRDWSDLRIAVTAGVWLASARPGDVIEIVSDDRAFDAVGDVAATLGIAYRRLSYRGLLGMRAPAAPAAAARPEPERAPGHEPRGRRHRGGRGRRDWRETRPATPPPAPAPEVAAGATPEADAQPVPHTAPHDEIVNVVRDLVRSSPGRDVTLDLLANALKARGFSRPPGSPRLITRLRRIKELEVNRAGVIALLDAAEAARRSEAAHGEEPSPDAETSPPEGNAREPEPVAAAEPGNEAAPPSGQRRRTRRGGRRHRSRSRQNRER